MMKVARRRFSDEDKSAPWRSDLRNISVGAASLIASSVHERSHWESKMRRMSELRVPAFHLNFFPPALIFCSLPKELTPAAVKKKMLFVTE